MVGRTTVFCSWLVICRGMHPSLIDPCDKATLRISVCVSVSGSHCLFGFVVVVCFVLTASFGLVVRRPPRERKIPGSNPACAGIFWGSSHTSDLKIGTPVASLPGAWRYRVSTGTGRPGVNIL